MKDRVPGKPGRVELRYDDGTKVQVTMTRADEPAEEGTPLCKATLLPDDVCDALGVDRTESTPADALMSDAVSEKVGDIRISRRNDLGDEYLLCNGQSIAIDSYPVLHEKSVFQLFRQDNKGVKDTITYANGYFAAQQDSFVSYTLDLDQSWNQVRISGIDISLTIGLVFFKNLWVSINRVGSDGYVSYTSELDKSWTNKRITSGYVPDSVDCSDKLVVAVSCKQETVSGETVFTSYITYAEDPAGTWHASTLVAQNVGIRVEKIRYINGVWVALGFTQNTAYPYIFYAADPAGAWSRKQIYNEYAIPTDIEFANGIWCIVARMQNGSIIILYANDLNGIWEAQKGVVDRFNPTKIRYMQSRWIITGQKPTSGSCAGVLLADDCKGSWCFLRLSQDKGTANGIATDGGKIAICGYTIENGTVYISSCTFVTPVVPTIAVSDAYAYIRGK